MLPGFSTTILIVLCFPLVVAKCIAVVQEYECAIIFRFGRVKKAKVVQPGIYFVNPCLETVVKVDLRTRSFEVPPQEILTKDSVTVTVDAVVYYNIHDPLASVINVANADKSTKQIAATTLRSILGTKTLQETLAERDRIGEAIYAQVKEATDAWGVQVERVEVKDVRLPKQMQRAMAAEAEAARGPGRPGPRWWVWRGNRRQHGPSRKPPTSWGRGLVRCSCATYRHSHTSRRRRTARLCSPFQWSC